jgi:4,5-dihydroxyphthalate decarboxylase
VGESVERDYFRRSGIFPPMHLIAVRKELAERPGLAQIAVSPVAAG